MSQTITGHTVVMARLADGGEVPVRRGEVLPSGLADGEEARLRKAGAFDPEPVADLAGQGAKRAEVSPTAPAVGLLPASVTLGANPDPEPAPERPAKSR